MFVINIITCKHAAFVTQCGKTANSQAVDLSVLNSESSIIFNRSVGLIVG